MFLFKLTYLIFQRVLVYFYRKIRLFQVQIHPPLTFSAYFAPCICPKRCAGFLARKRKKPVPEQSQRPFRSRYSMILQYFGLFQPQKQENRLIYLVDKSGNLFGRGRRLRTLGLRFWRPPLYQLSYSPMLSKSSALKGSNDNPAEWLLLEEEDGRSRSGVFAAAETERATFV